MKSIIFRNIFFILALSAIAGFASCHSSDEPEKPGDEKRGRRTVLVYMLANNNLGSSFFDADDLREMLVGVENGALGDGGRLLVFHEPADGSAPVLKEVCAGGIVELKVYPAETCGVEAGTMSTVLDDMKAEAPALSYGLVLWSHATGWIEDGIADDGSRADANAPAPLSFGASGREKMNITTMARVLAGRGLDFLYFDCCYMMGIESLYELRKVAPVMAGSPTELPSAGMPYDKTLPFFFAEGAADLEGAARATFDHYNALSGTARMCTMSVVRTAALPRLAAATKAIYEGSRAGMPTDGFTPQRYSAVSLERCNYFDFAQYVRHLAAGSPDKLAEFESALSEVVQYEDATPYLWGVVALTHHSGLSTYILPGYSSASDRGYNTLAWWADVASTLQH
ncbi:MAG: hypothetical protein K2M06_03300 [Muribaculaceae bacterium]|nr:hypothetical protein [Muribaculaceae bacterium]